MCYGLRVSHWASIALLVCASSAQAQDALDRAWERYGAGEYADARRELTAFADADENDRDQLVRYLEISALVAFAEEDDARLSDVLEMLVALEASFAFVRRDALPGEIL